jgi:hypothetical protein
MGNSNVKLQRIVDGVSAIGDLNPLFASTGGYAAEPALTIANDVASELFSERFPWKWNQRKIPPFFLIPRQQDYAQLGIFNIGWLTSAYRIDLNSNVIPPNSWPVEVVRDLKISRVYAGWPTRICWLPNDQMEQGPWPGPLYTYTDPLGQVQTPYNAWTNITDDDGNILVLTEFGTTGLTPPQAPPWVPPPQTPNLPPPENWPIGQVIQDGTCEWTVADPDGQGFRIWPPPPDSSANTWLIRAFGQKKTPYFSSLQQKLNPIPDDQIKWFRDGFVAYAHRYSSNPNVVKRFEQMRENWLQAMAAAAKQGDREDEGYGFFPANGLMSPEWVNDPGPGNPYWRNWGGS